MADDEQTFDPDAQPPTPNYRGYIPNILNPFVAGGLASPSPLGGTGVPPPVATPGNPLVSATKLAKPNAVISAASPAPSGGSFFDALAQAESGNQNIPQAIHDINTDKGTPAGGFFQIIDPTWQRYGKAAGVDLAKFPTAMSAPREVQAQVAAAIPFNQFGPRTQQLLTKQFGQLDHNATIGQLAAAHGGVGASPTAVANGASSGEAAPTASPGIGKLYTLAMIQQLFPQHAFHPVDYDPFAVMPKTQT